MVDTYPRNPWYLRNYTQLLQVSSVLVIFLPSIVYAISLFHCEKGNVEALKGSKKQRVKE